MDAYLDAAKSLFRLLRAHRNRDSYRRLHKAFPLRLPVNFTSSSATNSGMRATHHCGTQKNFHFVMHF